jgi:hypothetical protein
MPATARELKKFPAFRHVTFIPCFCHVGNLLMLDQPKLESVANLVATQDQSFGFSGQVLFVSYSQVCRCLLCDVVAP